MPLPFGEVISIIRDLERRNSYENEKNRLILTVFAKDIMEVEDVEEDEENIEETILDENNETISLYSFDG